MKGRKHSEETKEKIRQKRKLQIIGPRSEETRKKMSVSKMGQKNPQFGRIFTYEERNERRKRWTGRKHTMESREKMSRNMKGIKKINGSGENHWNWQGGKTEANMRIRGSLEYAQWRTAVFERDGYKCTTCGAGGYVEADHVLPFAYYPAHRLLIENGRTLCEECHKQTATSGTKLRWTKPFESQYACEGVL